jgi:hypothetical protein
MTTALFALVLGGVSWPPVAQGKLYMTRDQALTAAFGDSSTIETRTAYLTEAQVATVEEAAHAPFSAARVTYYVARDPAATLLGHAYIETHRVRTQAETIMVVVDTLGHVARVEVLAFHEPEDYLPPARWLELFDDRPLSPQLAAGRELPNLSGATLTARAMSDAVRRLLAVHAVVTGSNVTGPSSKETQ